MISAFFSKTLEFLNEYLQMFTIYVGIASVGQKSLRTVNLRDAEWDFNTLAEEFVSTIWFCIHSNPSFINKLSSSSPLLTYRFVLTNNPNRFFRFLISSDIK